jgi:hypothetical protein
MTYSPTINIVGTGLDVGQETFPRLYPVVSAQTLSSGNMRTGIFRARKTETTTQVRFIVGQAAAGGSTGVTSAYIGLYTVASDGAMTRVAVTADIKTSLTSTGAKTVSWASSYAIVAGTLLAVGIGATYDSTTAPGVSATNGVAQGECAQLPPVALLLAMSSGTPATSYSSATVTASTAITAPYFAILP